MEADSMEEDSMEDSMEAGKNNTINTVMEGMNKVMDKVMEGKDNTINMDMAKAVAISHVNK